jgi:5-methylcytosine-specific restriction endonuclease McrA
MIVQTSRSKGHKFIENILEPDPSPGSRAEYILLREHFRELDVEYFMSSDRHSKARENMSYLKLLKMHKDLQCSYCGKEGLVIYEFQAKGKQHSNMATVDHFIPSSKGGSSKPENLVVACWNCNHLKKDKVFPVESLKSLCSMATFREVEKYNRILSLHVDSEAYENFSRNIPKKRRYEQVRSNASTPRG